MKNIKMKGAYLMTNNKTFVKAILLTFLSVVIVISDNFISNAAIKQEKNINLYYVNISNYAVNFEKNGIKVDCSANLKSNKSVFLKIKMELQKEKSKGYETIETWTNSKTGTFIILSKTRNINVLSKYRLKVTFTAGDEIVSKYKYL